MQDTKQAKATPARLRTTPHRRLDIQGLRALAVLFVVAFHANLPLPGGFVGVDVFFVVSGFVITAMLIREKLTTGRISLSDFYVRRFRRLTPALALMVTVTVVVTALPFSSLTSQGMVAATAIGSMFLFANYSVAVSTGGYFDPAAELNPLLHTWSLSFEEQFYLVLPVLFIAAWFIGAKLKRPKLAVAIALAGLGLVSLAVALVTSRGYAIPFVPDTFVGFYGPIGRAWEFAAGALLAIVASRVALPSRRVATVLGLGGVALLAFAVVALSGANAFPGQATLVPVVGTLLLLYVGMTPHNPVSTALASRPLVYLGDISYSWYLWHWPVITFASFIWPGNLIVPVLAAIISLVPAYLSYRFVEQPLRRPIRATRRGFVVLVAITLLVPVALSQGLSFVLTNGYWSAPIREMQATQDMHAGIAAGCMSYVAITSETQGNCEWNSAAKGEPIYLVGDSIADHYSEALIGASENLNRPLFMATAAGCPAWTVLLEQQGKGTVNVTEQEGCTAYIEGTLDWLDEQPPGLVIMGARDISWWSPTDLVGPLTAGDDGTASTDDKETALVSAISSSAERLRSAGHQVVLTQAPPSYRVPAPAWLPMSCSISSIVNDSCAKSVSIGEMDLLQGRTREAVAEAADRSGAEVLDLRDYFCSAGRCMTKHGDLNLYLDDIHISVAASENLVPIFTEFIRRQR
jgi:peptidoglycan/LPS O-acetylase OafA/YrhL